MSSPNSILQIDLAAIRHNMRALSRFVGPGTGICPVLKANAYGLGAERILRAVAPQARMVAVFSLEQARALLNGRLPVPILVLMPVTQLDADAATIAALRQHDIILSVHGPDHLATLAALCEPLDLKPAIHLDIDTGMSRGGCSPDDAVEVAQRAASSGRFRLAGVYTHVSSTCEDLRSLRDHARTFDAVLHRLRAFLLPGALVHVANTVATLAAKSLHRDMVRVGLAWAGYGDDEFPETAISLQPCITWRSQLVHIKAVPAGTPVGYGQTWRAARPSVVGLVPVGYANGYPTTWAPGARPMVQVRTRGDLHALYAPVVGRVSMDQIVLDLTDLQSPSVRPGLRVGDPVELISPDPIAPNHLPLLARQAGIPPQELMCRIGSSSSTQVHGMDASALRPPVERAPEPLFVK
jgi:alanine racemase